MWLKTQITFIHLFFISHGGNRLEYLKSIKYKHKTFDFINALKVFFIVSSCYVM